MNIQTKSPYFDVYARAQRDPESIPTAVGLWIPALGP